MVTAPSAAHRLSAALDAREPSARLQAALAAGTTPDPSYVEILVRRCAVEPDFYVRDMLTWALTRHERDAVVDRLLPELDSDVPQARSQALHTLSKLGDKRAWPAITSTLLRDPDDEVARAAWRTAAGLVPAGGEAALAVELVSQLGRGDRDVQLSLSRALVMLGEAAEPALVLATSAADPAARTHALATQRLVEDPDEGFDAAVDEAQRLVALRASPLREV